MAARCRWPVRTSGATSRAGIELIRKKTGQEAYGFTMPLLTKSDGTKFGKTNGHAIWLDINKTSAYEMYQFFINSEDSKVIDYLKFLTFLSREEIEALEEKNRTEPHLREALRRWRRKSSRSSMAKKRTTLRLKSRRRCLAAISGI